MNSLIARGPIAVIRVLVSVWLIASIGLVRVCGQISSPGAITSFSPGGQYILLTFDDHPGKTNTSAILDILLEKKVKASFFVYGHKYASDHSTLQRMASEGHDVGLHGLTAHSITSIPHDKLANQMQQSIALVRAATKKAPAFFRPPKGKTNSQINDLIKTQLNMTVIMWSLDSKDHETMLSTEIRDNVLNKAQPGDIILCRVSNTGTIQALPDMLDGLYKQGYEFLTLSRIMMFPDDKPH
jgi:peptidoglycan/xylan/chitin deacetylase (PgdA/CDA1 family)